MAGLAAQLILAAIVLLLVILVGTSIGETSIPPATVLAAISNKIFGTDFAVSSAIEAGIVWNYRLTRIIVAACCGASLAVCGVVLQALLRNALADPYLLGISAGASTGAVTVMILGVGAGLLSLSLGAFVGAVVAFGLVSLLARAAGGVGVQATGLIILAGIAGSQLFNALTSFVIARSANAEQARGVMFWLMGNMSGVRWPDVALAIPVAVVGISICVLHMRALDAFTFGSDSAASLGVPVRRVQVMLIATASMMTAAMVSMVGAIGFVGLVVPHPARFVVGVRHNRLLPASAFAGAVFLVAADVVSRIVIPNQVLPIGVITALVGAPGFALILLRGRRMR